MRVSSGISHVHCPLPMPMVFFVNASVYCKNHYKHLGLDQTPDLLHIWKKTYVYQKILLETEENIWLGHPDLIRGGRGGWLAGGAAALICPMGPTLHQFCLHIFPLFCLVIISRSWPQLVYSASNVANHQNDS